MELKQYLQYMIENEASDLYLSTGAPPSVKISGKLTPISNKPIPPGLIKKSADALMSEDQHAEFQQCLEMNLAISETGLGRFRVNMFLQRGEVSMVIRAISTSIPTLEKLGLPDILRKIIMEKRGLILFVGATGSGKSTSLASLIDYRNANSAGHIITIEDPVEFIHRHRKSIVNQREVGLDTLTYDNALKNTLRQAPDVILIGEVRTRKTMEHCIEFSETGHLCLSTLHANNANQALDRIINFFPEERRNQLLLDLSLNLRAVISQRLVTTLTGRRTVAIEILLATPLVSDMIRRSDIPGLKEVMEKSQNLGMQTFDMSLFELYDKGVISLDEAIRNADSKNNVRLKATLKESPVNNNINSLSLQKSDGASNNLNDDSMSLNLSLDKIQHYNSQKGKE